MPLPRILLIGPTPPPVGGMAQINCDCLRALADGGQFEAVLVEAKAAPGRRAGRLNVQNVMLQLRLLGRLRHALRAGAAAAHLHASVGTPLTVAKNLQLARAVKAAGVPLLLHPHSGRLEELLAAPPGRWRRGMDALIACADSVVVMSPWWQQLLAEQFPAAKLALLPSGVDVDTFRPAAHAGGDPLVRVLFMGQLAEHKGLAELIAAWPAAAGQFPGLRLDVLGEARDGRGRELAAGLAALPGTSLHGIVTGMGKVELLQRADMFVMPSHYENLPVAMLEAMACGAACIGTAVGAVPELLGEGRGEIVPPLNSSALAAAISRLAGDPGMCRSMGAASREYVAHSYTSSAFTSRLHGLYHEAAARPAASPGIVQ